jgi:hypothetical protein
MVAIAVMLVQRDAEFIVLPKHKLQGFTHDRGFRGINELGVLGELRLDLLLNP